MSGLQVEDIQGLVLRGCGALKGARYLGLRIQEPHAAKAWLRTLEVRDASAKPLDSETCVKVALSPSGLAKLDLPSEVLAQFAPEFQQGMAATEHRKRLLGDVEDGAPSKWSWGGPSTPQIDVLLMLFAKDDTALAALVDQHRVRLARAALAVEADLDTHTLPDFKEHFGFRDGISQPQIAGWDKPGPAHNEIAAGEFVLGCENAYGQFVERPLLAADLDPSQLLPQAPDKPERRDFFVKRR
jgi:deferrochelatase/peroxidase EfeB